LWWRASIIMACSAYNPFCEIFMVFYTAINPMVLIEFIDITEISNLDARPSSGKRLQYVPLFQSLEKIADSTGGPRMCSDFPLG
jgi:hypothetical protein